MSTLTKSGSYIQTLNLRPVAALPGSFELLIHSQLLSARDPSAKRVQHRVIVTESALSDLRSAIDHCLAASHGHGKDVTQ
jgi:hypothetical protein